MITKFYIDHKHNHVDVADLTFTDYINSDYRVARQMLEAYCFVNNLVLNDTNCDELRVQFTNQMKIK